MKHPVVTLKEVESVSKIYEVLMETYILSFFSGNTTDFQLLTNHINVLV